MYLDAKYTALLLKCLQVLLLQRDKFFCVYFNIYQLNTLTVGTVWKKKTETEILQILN